MAAEQKQILLLGIFHRHLLGQDLSLGRQVDHMGLLGQLGADRLITAKNGVRLHDHPHASAIGSIIYPAVFIQGIVTDIVTVNLQ